MKGTAGADLGRCRDLGREGGLAAGLTAVLEGLDVAAEAPGGSALLPMASLERGGAAGGAEVLPHPFAALEGLALVRFTATGTGAGAGLTALRAARLAAVRVGVLSALLDAAVERLSARRFGGVPLIDHQLVGGALADVVTEIEIASVEPASGSAEAVWDRHERLTEAGWATTRLFGAEGYITGHPVRALYLSSLASDLWLARPGVPEGAR
ncbi:acyl-CoA dehydrogenase family protein [Streptomyces sp. NPDC057287]|uniref:acyl-CoA dehydrogenase family protein n=1 Tax=Streptomyces sp. NPDC057287 TaxID=3346086 RepID=UPI00363FB704